MKYQLNFNTSHHQFYVHDKNSISDTNSENFWSESAYNDRLAIGDGVLGVGIECYGSVKVEINILDSAITIINLDEYDHVVEACIDIKSGVFQILDCPLSNLELELNVNPGFYKVRIYSLNLASVYGDKGDDFYKLEIWPDYYSERKVLKRYMRNAV